MDYLHARGFMTSALQRKTRFSVFLQTLKIGVDVAEHVRGLTQRNFLWDDFGTGMAHNFYWTMEEDQ